MLNADYGKSIKQKEDNRESKKETEELQWELKARGEMNNSKVNNIMNKNPVIKFIILYNEYTNKNETE